MSPEEKLKMDLLMQDATIQRAKAGGYLINPEQATPGITEEMEKRKTEWDKLYKKYEKFKGTPLEKEMRDEMEPEFLKTGYFRVG